MSEFSSFLFKFANGLTFAGLLFMIASGFTLIFGLMRVVNLAHAVFYILAGLCSLDCPGGGQQLGYRDDRRNNCCRYSLRF